MRTRPRQGGIWRPLPRVWPWALAAALACAPSLAAHADEGVPLGKDLAGEACHFAAPVERNAPADPILCGANSNAVGTLWSSPASGALPTEPAARRAAIIETAHAIAAPLAEKSALRCSAGDALSGTSDALIFACTEESSGWPRIVLVTSAGDIVYAADGLPALLPVLQAGLAAATGRPFSADETEAAFRIVDQKFPGELARAGGADAASYKALIELGRLDGAANDYAGAEAAYRRALDIETRIFGGNATAVGETLMELALQVSNQARFDEAAGLFRRAETIVDAAPDVAARARLASYRALDAANQRHFADALKFAHAASQMRRQELGGAGGPAPAAGADAAPAPSRGELAHSLRIEAEMALRLGDLPTALASATEVLEIINQEPGLPLWWRPEAVMMMAEIDARRERVVSAERQFRAAIEMEKRLFGETAPTALSMLRLGQFYSDQQVYSAAVEAYEPAFAILARDPVTRAAIVPDQILPYLEAVAQLAKTEPGKRAALYAEAFRASQLIGSDVAGRTIARAAQRLAADSSGLKDLLTTAQDAQRQRNTLRIELAAETAKPDDRRSAARERSLAEELGAASDKADAAAREIAAKFPAYAHFADPGPAGLDSLQHALGPGEAFLTYVAGARSSYAILVTAGSMQLQRIDTTNAALASDVAELRRAFVPRLGAVGDFDLALSYELYRLLLAPIEPGLGDVAHLVVAPSGALASLPFGLLVTAAPAASARHDYRAASWLLRRMDVSQVPSARGFLELRQGAARRVAAPKPLLAVADPALSGPMTESDGSASRALAALSGRCRENGPMPADVLRALPPLHETANEVRAVDRVLGPGGDLLLGAGATEAALRARPLDQYRVLYFATHGLLPGELHCQAEPGLVLSPPPQTATSTDEDGVLEASEIAGLKLNADLVVLSACNTAESGGQFGGEALDGLAESFFNAGARTVLASHWEVPSLATVRLMTSLFEARARDPRAGLAGALRQAQLGLVNDPATSHPYFWAAFSIIGDGAAPDRTVAVPAADEPSRGRT
ncbi:MAG TPA: CHAT domain-containing protein [Stellaceae bacterium]|nr:CHAT domain-containing protein [Stellaceae bacterium]